jgi:hypothetical protein
MASRAVSSAEFENAYGADPLLNLIYLA